MAISNWKRSAGLLLPFLTLAAGQQISSGCAAFLTGLDKDTSIQQCTSKLLNVTSTFNPTTSNNSQTVNGIKDTLISICQSTIEFCDLPTLSTVLNSFSGNCSDEVTGSAAVPSVVSLYDALYIVKPLKDAMCSTDASTGNSCLLEIAGSNQTTAVSGNATVAQDNADVSDIAPANSTVRTYAQMAETFDITRYAGSALVPANLYVQAENGLNKRWNVLEPRQEAPASASASTAATTADNTTDPTAGIVTANATTFVQANIPFLFLSAAMPASQLCQSCTQAVVAAYVAFESVVPYAGGLKNSYLLSSQAPFWNALGSTCGEQFLANITSQAGQNDASTSFSGAVDLKMGLASVVSLVAALALL